VRVRSSERRSTSRVLKRLRFSWSILIGGIEGSLGRCLVDVSAAGVGCSL
jgi:hypothetical protein